MGGGHLLGTKEYFLIDDLLIKKACSARRPDNLKRGHRGLALPNFMSFSIIAVFRDIIIPLPFCRYFLSHFRIYKILGTAYDMSTPSSINSIKIRRLLNNFDFHFPEDIFCDFRIADDILLRFTLSFTL